MELAGIKRPGLVTPSTDDNRKEGGEAESPTKKKKVKEGPVVAS